MKTGVTIDEEILRATNSCDCSAPCDCNEVFEGTSVDPDSEEATQQAKEHIHKSATYKALPMWFTLLTFMHSVFCNVVGCKGIPKLENILDSEDVDAND